jgi:hypothetical protein
VGGPTLGTAFREIAVPRPRWFLVFHLGVVAHALLYWITSFVAEPGLPMAVRVIFRPDGDPQYFPLVAALARLNFGEPALLESYGQGVGAFPYASISLHGLACALFGSAGYVVGDVLAALLYFLTFGAFLRVLGIPRSWAIAVAALLATDVLTSVWGQLIHGAGLLPGATQPFFWGNRLPRPLVSENFTLLAAAAAVRIARTSPEAPSPRTYAGGGAALAALMQADVHTTVTHGCVFLLLLLALPIQRRRLDRVVLRCLGAFAAGLLVVGWPFAVQQLLVHPDLPRRLGAFAVSRARPLFDPGIEWPRLWNLLAATAIAYLAVPRILPRAREQRLVPALMVVASTGVISFFALPISCLLAGTVVQPYHFIDRWWRASAYAFLVIGLWLGRGLMVLLEDRWEARWWHWFRARALGPVLGLVAVGLMGRQLHRQYPVTLVAAAPRSDFARYAAIPDYKASFTDLCRELASGRHRQARTLATLDHHLYVFWTAFAGRFALVPDPFSSFAPDGELEDRLLGYLKLLGVKEAELPALLSERSTLVFFLSHDKHQASRAHHFAPTREYPAANQAAIRTGSIYASWEVALPRSELERLGRRYAATEPSGTGGSPSPDLIVLGPQELAAGHLPPPDRFELAYRNGAFQLWSRRDRSQ